MNYSLRWLQDESTEWQVTNFLSLQKREKLGLIV